MSFNEEPCPGVGTSVDSTHTLTLTCTHSHTHAHAFTRTHSCAHMVADMHVDTCTQRYTHPHTELAVLVRVLFISCPFLPTGEVFWSSASSSSNICVGFFFHFCFHHFHPNAKKVKLLYLHAPYDLPGVVTLSVFVHLFFKTFTQGPPCAGGSGGPVGRATPSLPSGPWGLVG